MDLQQYHFLHLISLQLQELFSSQRFSGFVFSQVLEILPLTWTPRICARDDGEERGWITRNKSQLMMGDAWEDWNGNKVLMMMVKKENENWKNIAKLMMVMTREKMKLEQSWWWQERKKDEIGTKVDDGKEKKMKWKKKLMWMRREDKTEKNLIMARREEGKWKTNFMMVQREDEIEQHCWWWWQGEK